MDEEIRSFIEDVVDTDVKKDLLVFLHDNPTFDTCQGLSVWVNHSPSQIAAEIDDLVLAGVLNRHGEGEHAIYSYHPVPELHDTINRFVIFYRDRRDAVQSELSRLRADVERARREGLRRAGEERSKTRAIIASMADGVVVVDAAGVVVMANPAAGRILGFDMATVAGRPLHEVVTFPDLKDLVEEIDSVARQQYTMLSREIAITEPHRVFKANISPVRDVSDADGNGAIIGIVAVLRDITELKDLDAMKNDFISMVSHELRSPLTSIKGFAALLSRGVFGGLNEKQMESTGIINEQCDRLLELINDLLELSSVEAGHRDQNMGPVSILAVIEKCVALVQPQADEKNIAVTKMLPAELPIIEADEANIEHVVTNLLTNAVKYTLADGRVSVAAEDCGDEVMIRVTDTGIGIPAEAQKKIFDKFFRVKDKRARMAPGTGLGLAIVRNIVEAHMGRIELVSEEDKGSTFTVYLPHRRHIAEQTEEDPVAVAEA